MSQATYVAGDVRDCLAALPDGSVDLVLTSPPFLALRSYLPADHLDKHREIGGEPTPAAFIDTMLGLSAEWRRVLAPHGSIAVELGDTYSNSGGGGGDYLPGGRREGQAQFAGSGAAMRESNASHWRAKNEQRSAWPQAKSLTMIPELYRVALAYGINPLTGQPSPAGSWRCRNVVRWARPNPPVGALGDKFRPATSDMVIACTARDRYFDLNAVRIPAEPGKRTDWTYANADADDSAQPGNTTRKRGGTLVDNPAGAPPLDHWWADPDTFDQDAWLVSTEPYGGSHYATWPRKLLTRPILAMCPPFVCTICGPIYPLQSSHDAVSLRGMRGSGDQSEGDSVLLSGMFVEADESEPYSASEGTGTTSSQPPIRLRGAPMVGASNGEQVRGRVRAPSDHGGAPWPNADIGRGGPPSQRDQGRQSDRESRSDDGSGAPQGADATMEAKAVSPLRRTGVGGEPCSTCGATLRRGVVLDPFAGSGTTLAVATGHGRDAIGFDFDSRNADLALERVGPMFLTVQTLDEWKVTA